MSTNRSHQTSTESGTPPALDVTQLRRAFGEFSTGVTVVTYRDDDGNPRGATMNSFTSVSMDPPLALISVARSARACAGLQSRPFTVNILSANQLDIALAFAGKPIDGLSVPWHDTASAPPRILGSTAWLHCDPWQTYDGGDHVLIVGQIRRYDARRLDPLTFHRGEFRRPGLKLLQLPRTVAFDGRPAAEWVDRVHRLHAIADAGITDDPLDI
ncbi:flavin reductase family protein [Gordonia sp. TBRC 11910]|uniref:Flavin reductase family protein n=1 Tax=Gordonia asplenii TaxID=2725283 RepID=A0A848KRI7_9ACTN|nr:flavin reductase family protein [Gordonia asplenii]NMO00547.1 flavin reductase family protein [Gordonia asplenii]